MTQPGTAGDNPHAHHSPGRCLTTRPPSLETSADLVGHQCCDGQAGIVPHAVVIAEGQGEQPLGYVVLGHDLLVLCPTEQGQVGQGLGAASQDVVVCAATAPAQDDLQTPQVDHLPKQREDNEIMT